MKKLLLSLLLFAPLIVAAQNMTGPSGNGNQFNALQAIRYFRPPIQDTLIALKQLASNGINGDSLGAIVTHPVDSIAYRYNGFKWERLGAGTPITTFYSGDGAFSGNRTVDGNTHGLTFNDLGFYSLNADSYSWFSPSYGAGIGSDGLGMSIQGATAVSSEGHIAINAGKPESLVTLGSLGGAGTGNSGVRLHNIANNVTEDSVLSTDITGIIKMKVVPAHNLHQTLTAGNTSTFNLALSGAVASDFMGAFINTHGTNGHGIYARADAGIPFRADIGPNIFGQLNGGGRWLFGLNTPDDGVSAVQITGHTQSSSISAGTYVSNTIPFTVRASQGIGNSTAFINNTNNTAGTYGLYIDHRNTDNTSKGFAVANNAVEQMVFTGAGRLGIGTSTPEQAVDVLGTLQVGAAAVQDNGRVRITSSFQGVNINGETYNVSSWQIGRITISANLISLSAPGGVFLGSSPISAGSLIVANSAAFGIDPNVKSAGFTAGDEMTYRISNASGTINVTLPTASTVSGRLYMFQISTGTGGFAVTIGGNAVVLGSGVKGPLAMVQSDGTNWILLQGF